MFVKTLSRLFGTKHERDMKLLQPVVQEINRWEPKFKAMSNDDLKAMTPAFIERIANGESLDSVLPESFAVCREASSRVLGMRHYDVQLIGGMTLHKGAIAEMRTGEGKTLVATLPVYLNSLTKKGVHVVTVNDYLAKRDEEWMGRLYKWLGMTTGTIVHDLDDRQRQQSYGADITYGTNNEFGFDYLRDNMKFDLRDYVQRELNFAIVDECDSILIDEARTPLIISGPSEDSTDKYYEINKIIPHLKLDIHFTMEEKSKTASLTEEGNSRAEEMLGIDNLYDPRHITLLHHIYQGLKAYHLYKLDVDYMIKDGEVVIVDEFTGRLMPGRRWSDGLHQAIEAKEGVRVKSENQTLATITFQNYFRMYNKMGGMTGTAETEAVEFKKIYNLDVFVIPTNMPICRQDKDDVVYKTEAAKFKAIAEDIKKRNTKGQPCLVGTVSIEKSEKLSSALKRMGVTHNVLNAKHHEREAEIVAQAGRKGAITIATNMAGRGTDIVLGGNAEFLAKRGGQEESSDEYKESFAKYKDLCGKERSEVVASGGLYIIGTERHESRRIDNQLRGRSGRQGDPGESRFYLSLEDNLMRIFNGERIQKIMNTLKVPEDEPIVAGMVTRAIEGAQRKVEGHNFDIRKHLLEYDDVMNKQRHAVYTQRRMLLAGKNIERTVLDFLGDVSSQILDTFANEKVKTSEWDLDGLNTALRQQFGVAVEKAQLVGLPSDMLTNVVSEAVKAVYDRQKVKLGEHFEQIAKMILLQTIDHKWKEHLQSIDRLKEGINLRAYAQKDPVIEYKKEAFTAFEAMNTMIMVETIEKLLKIQVASPELAAEEFSEERARDFNESEFSYEGPEEEAIGSFGAPTATGAGLPFARSNEGRGGGHPPRGQEMFLSRGSDSNDYPKLNRAQRREAKKKNKKKLKF